jgi:hypothetical protein
MRLAKAKCAVKIAVLAVAVQFTHATTFAAAPQWSNFAGDAQHTADSAVASDSLSSIRWQTPVDLDPQYSGSELLIHYGSPLVTATNNVIVPVKTGAAGGFEIEGLSGSTGSTLWSASTDYTLPPHDWTPSYAPALTPTNRLYYAGDGGTIYYRDAADTASPSAPIQAAFYGLANYTANSAAYNSSVFINTPITSDSAGDIFFGFRVSGTAPAGSGLPSNGGGIARIGANGSVSFVTAAVASGNGAITNDVMNAAPALSNDGKTVYVTVGNGPSSIAATGDLVALNSSTLATESAVALKDPSSGSNAWLPDDGTASPMVGPDGNVYIGVLENPFPANHDRGWMLSFSSNLSTTNTPGSFGWDDTASVVPASMVPSYHGSSTYLLMTKYNNYAGAGISPNVGDGVNKLAILDPNSTMIDPITGATVMKEVETIAGVTPDADKVADGYPNAVDEWCIDSAVVDPATDSVIAGSEDGKLYRWDLATNTFTEMVTLTPGLGEAYTPTMIAADGSVLAINNATLFDIVPEPGTIGVLTLCGMITLTRRRRLITSR